MKVNARKENTANVNKKKIYNSTGAIKIYQYLDQFSFTNTSWLILTFSYKYNLQDIKKHLTERRYIKNDAIFDALPCVF